VGLAGAGWAEEDHVLLGGDEVEGAQVCDQVAGQTAGVVEVELFQALAGRESRRSDPALAAVGVAGGDFALQAGNQVLLVRPRLRAGSFGQTVHRVAQGGCFQRPGEVGDLGGRSLAGVALVRVGITSPADSARRRCRSRSAAVVPPRSPLLGW
jgi:hypothetical protein